MIFTGAGATGRRNRTRLIGRSGIPEPAPCECSAPDLQEEALGPSLERFDGQSSAASNREQVPQSTIVRSLAVERNEKGQKDRAGRLVGTDECLHSDRSNRRQRTRASLSRS